MEMGSQQPDDRLEETLKSIAVNQCCTIVYTVSITAIHCGTKYTNIYLLCDLTEKYPLQNRIISITTYPYSIGDILTDVCLVADSQICRQ